MAERETCKDFHTGQIVLRWQSRPSERCANCGRLTLRYDAKYGWHICNECNSDETAAEIARDVMSA